MNHRAKSIAFVLFACLSTANGLKAAEDGIKIHRFCLKDPRFEKHLLDQDDGGANNRLKNKAFTYLVTLTSFVRDFSIDVNLQKGSADQVADTFLKMQFTEESDMPNVIVTVNPKSNFASAYFSTCRELILAREILRHIRDSDITFDTSYQDFTEIYRKEHKEAVHSLQKNIDFHSFFDNWINSEKLATEVKAWQKNELEEVSEFDRKIPRGIKNRIDFLFSSIKTGLNESVERPPQKLD